VLANLASGGFCGAIWPVNPEYRRLEGMQVHADVADLPGCPGLVMAQP
jgi:acyl-CoA synthetase (NDP forming)